MTLQGKKVAIFIAPVGTEEAEFVKPREALEKAGATVTVVSLKKGEAQMMKGDTDKVGTAHVDRTFDEVKAADFDGIVIPGGTVGADKLRSDEAVIRFVREIMEAGKPVAAICHAPWILAEADVLKGRSLTSYPSIRTDLKNAGATWTDSEVVCDQALVTSRNPNDLPAFCAKMIEELGEGRHAGQSRSV